MIKAIRYELYPEIGAMCYFAADGKWLMCRLNEQAPLMGGWHE